MAYETYRTANRASLVSPPLTEVSGSTCLVISHQPPGLVGYLAMGLFKKSKTWHYDFWFKKTRYQGSTSCTNHEAAKLWLSKYKINLAMQRVGLVEPKIPPTLSVFLNGPFWDSILQNITKPNTLSFYQSRIKTLSEYVPFTQLTLDKIDELAVQAYKDSRIKAQMAISSINAELKVLRKAMIFADVCGFTRYKRIRALPGEKGRTFVVSGELEKAYLSVAPYPLKQVAILMLDLGLRPEEAVSLRKDDVFRSDVTIRSGKTINARRVLPQTERTREVFGLCNALFPDSEWVFPGLKGQHYGRKSLSNLHNRLRAESSTQTATESAALTKAMPQRGMQADGAKIIFPREFVIYSFRHTFGTRLAQSGARPDVIKKAMGHSSIRISEIYLHPDAADLSLAMKRCEQWGRVLRGEAEIHADNSSETSIKIS